MGGPDLLSLLNERSPLLFDGAIGTEIQKLTLADAEWGGRTGCNEALNLSSPHVIREIHRSYLEAGADVIETNSFGASAFVLAEYGLGDEAREVSAAAARIAREAVSEVKDRRCFVAGALGPGTKLPSLGHAGFDDIYRAYLPAAYGLLDGGVDLFLLETCQDPLQIKACLCALRDAQTERGIRLPVAVSVTVETTGTLLVGTEPQAVAAILAALSVDIIGINCATGPRQMALHVRELCRSFPGPVLVMPNAGLPENVNGALVYTLPPDEFAADLREFVEKEGVNLAGGCCGTGPAHIAALKKALAGVRPAARSVTPVPGVTGLYSFQELRQEPPPFFVGERANTNGSREFRERLLADDWDGMVEVGKRQVESGAHAVDLSVAYAGRDEVSDMTRLVPQFALRVPLPLVIDSTSPRVIEEALKRHGGRAIINSVNLEDGGGRAREICNLARRHGAAVIALTIDEAGMAQTAEKKLAVARRLYQLAVDEAGLRPQDLIFDPLTFTLGSGDETLKNAGKETLAAIGIIKKELPGVFTLLGVSNISFGLSARARVVLNSVFLHRAAAAGLDLAIVNVSQIVPVARIDEIDVRMANDLIDNTGAGNPLLDLITHFSGQSGGVPEGTAEARSLPPEELLRRRVIDSSRTGLEELLEELRKTTAPADIINTILVPAMKRVGELFGSGAMQLPFVLQSAEVMKRSVDLLAPYMEKVATAERKSIVLATVKGDVHDIGKNLVDIILTNNGFRVHNLGIRADIESIIAAARDHGADAIGMSGLLVKSTQVMKENIEFMKAEGLDIPVLLGGAALTRGFVLESCAPLLDSPVIYCEDAFRGLQAMNLLKEGKLAEYAEAERVRYSSRKQRIPSVTQDRADAPRPAPSIPAPPFFGSRVLGSIAPESLFPLLDETVLFKARWGFRRGALPAGEFDALITREAKPALTRMKERLLSDRVLAPQAVYGYWPCAADGDGLIIYDPDDPSRQAARFHFPRQSREPGRSIADYFLAAGGAPDVIALQAVTIGPGLDALVHGLYDMGDYRDYLFYHGFGVELAEALAVWMNGMIRKELGIAQGGLRYSFGYPPCPHMEDNRTLLNLLGAGRIGIETVESGGMAPEQSTSAFFVHHPQARYFAV
ncbi:MAG: methionine synthase [Spirochaetes bacterium]|nr:methionine synthase [Spirochaetota bacterium]